MTLTAYYSAGTATLTNGSTAVVGIGTAWTTNNLAPGDQIETDSGLRATIASINSPTSITLDKNFAGTTQTAAPYKIWRTFDAQYLMEGARAAMNLLGSGSVAALADLAGEADKGMYFTGPNVLALFSLTAAARTLLADASASDMRDTLGVTDALDALSASIATAAANVGKRGTVRVASAANITIATGLNAADVIDGVALVAGDLVLVKNQTAPEQNGIYVVGPAPARSSEFDTYNEHPGSLIVVQEGATQADSFWYCTSNVGGTLGTTAIAYSQMTISLVDDSVTNAKLANMANATIKGRATAGTGDPEDLTLAQFKALLLSGTVIREVLTVNRTYYVRADGSDSNTGLVNNAGGAFLTIQKAVDVIAGSLDIGAFKVTIQVGAGTYTGAVAVTGPWVGSGDVELTGDTATPANCTMNVAGTALTVQSGGRLLMKGMKLTNSAGRLIIVTSFGYLKLSGKNEFGASSGYCMVADSGRIDAISEEILSGSAGGGHYLAVNDGIIFCQSAIWTATASISFPAFAVATNGSIYTAFNSSTGTITGARYSATLNGVINTNGGGASVFPGNAVGTTGSGGQYA